MVLRPTLTGKGIMDTLLLKVGGWLAVVFFAFIAMVLAVDSGFAVHMGIIALAAAIVLWVTISKADYAAIGRGILRAPADPGVYDDDPIRWGVIATIFWGIVGFSVGDRKSTRLNSSHVRISYAV